jgi:hypothetical protein
MVYLAIDYIEDQEVICLQSVYDLLMNRIFRKHW